MTKKEQLATIHARAKAQFDKIQSAVRDERQQCLEDRRFYSIAGAQWEGKLGEQFANKPKFEVNKIHLAVIRIINEYRNNRITVDFVSKDGSQNDELADTCDGLYRADEQDSGAEEAYDNAFEEAVGGGFGAFRLRACEEDEEDEENERQRIKIEPIFDADSCVFFDLDAKRQDKADANFCFVLTSMTHDAYKEEYGDDPASWNKDISNSEFDWCTPDIVYVAEYYVVEKVKEKQHIFVLIDGTEQRYMADELEKDPSIQERLDATGAQELRIKTLERRKVRKYMMSGSQILEDCGYIAGRYIPIVPVYGKRWFVDNVERCMGHVRLCKDVQRLKNMQLSRLGEIAALSPIEKPIMAPEQVAGFEHMWANDNIDNNPYLLANPLTDINGNVIAQGPISYTKPPQVPQSLAALLQLTDVDIRELLGNQEQGEKINANVSAEAIDLVQNQLGMQSYIYIDNFAKAIKRCGAIWLSMAKELYVEEGRRMKTIGKQDEVDSAELSRPVIGESGIEYENDLTKASFDVGVDVGPTSSSKKSAIVRQLQALLPYTSDQQDMKILLAMIYMNMEGEGIKDFRNYYRKWLVQIGVVEPTEEEQQELIAAAQNQQPDPQAQLAEALTQESLSKAEKARADTFLTAAKTEQTKADTAKTIASMENEQRDSVVNAIEKINQNMASAQPMSEGVANV
ncbi:portal protein [Acinetobacter baumannii]|uniref:portal protein n=2 Tax=Acinetobacter baumannii TaxID=470 RepID=UPI00280D34C7|nr:portal protein [Acinetobacter baumannii]MDQ9112786.1 portal protein [Acinetobacter baumannii]MDT7992859.1 portal protein [Acinetobacter baumannii]MDW7583769.1 portal protein [Acinetobacter baumannii]MEA3644559.1 portal protein [Acinetobacter baumannii]